MTKNEIRELLIKGNTGEYSHLIICCDTFDWEYYPVYVKCDDDIDKIISHYNNSMDKIIEIYNYNLDIESQLNEYRSENIYPKTLTKKMR